MTPVQISRDFADGTSETWSWRAAVHWRAYVMEMLRGECVKGRAVAIAVRLRLYSGQLLVIRPRSK
jgi:hypothetical protein